MSEAQRIGLRFMELVKEGKDTEIVKTMYSEDAVSIEASSTGDMPTECKGIEAILKKHDWWFKNMEFIGGDVKGPFPNREGTRFAVYFSMKIKDKNTGDVTNGEEVGLFTVENGKIIREEFFYES